MQGPITLDLARALATDHAHANHHDNTPHNSGSKQTLRHWLGNRLIRLGEALTEPGELQLKVSTGPPCP
jgi:hypothetical protein